MGILLTYMYVCVLHMCLGPMKVPEVFIRSPATEVIDRCKPPCRCWESNLGPNSSHCFTQWAIFPALSLFLNYNFHISPGLEQEEEEVRNILTRYNHMGLLALNGMIHNAESLRAAFMDLFCADLDRGNVFCSVAACLHLVVDIHILMEGCVSLPFQVNIFGLSPRDNPYQKLNLFHNFQLWCSHLLVFPSCH